MVISKNYISKAENVCLRSVEGHWYDFTCFIEVDDEVLKLDTESAIWFFSSKALKGYTITNDAHSVLSKTKDIFARFLLGRVDTDISSGRATFVEV